MHDGISDVQAVSSRQRRQPSSSRVDGLHRQAIDRLLQNKAFLFHRFQGAHLSTRWVCKHGVFDERELIERPVYGEEINKFQHRTDFLLLFLLTWRWQVRGIRGVLSSYRKFVPQTDHRKSPRTAQCPAPRWSHSTVSIRNWSDQCFPFLLDDLL